MIVVGALIGVSGLIGFGLGILFAKLSIPSAEKTTSGPCKIHGLVAGESLRETMVILLPETMRPDKKMDFKTLRAALVRHELKNSAEYREIRSIGGDCVLSDRNGNFEVVLPGSDVYFLFAIAVSSRTNEYSPDTKTLAQLGRYFLNGNEILRGANFSWLRIEVHDGSNLTVSLES